MTPRLSGRVRSADSLTSLRAGSPITTLVVSTGLLLAIACTIAPAARAVVEVALR